MLTKLGEKTSAAQAKKNWPNRWLRVSKRVLSYFEGEDLFDEVPLRKCHRRGTRFSLLLYGSAWDFWCDGTLLVDDTGLAWRRAR